MKNKILMASAAALSVGLATSMPAHAGYTITGLVDTGAGLADGATDLNYAVELVPSADGASAGAVAVVGGGFPFPSWVTPPAGSNWISAFGRDQGLDPTSNGTYDYRLTFQVAAGEAFTITGAWATDNYGADILVNGLSSGQTSTGYAALTDFSVSGVGAVGGTDTLDFIVVNDARDGGNPTGLLVADLAYTVPEPASMAVLGTGFAGLGLIRRRHA